MPVIAMYAQIPAGTPAVERLFSIAGDVVSKKRARLAMTRAECLVLLKGFFQSSSFSFAKYREWMAENIRLLREPPDVGVSSDDDETSEEWIESDRDE